MRKYLISDELRRLLIESIGTGKPVNAGHSFNLHKCLSELIALPPVEEDTEEA